MDLRIFFLFPLIYLTNGQLAALLMGAKSNDDQPPPNPFGETDPPLTTDPTRTTHAPIDLGPRGNPNPSPNVNSPQTFNPVPSQNFNPNPQPPPFFNPPTPPPLPTPPPISSSNNNRPAPAPAMASNPNNPFDKLPVQDNSRAAGKVLRFPHKPQSTTWTQTRSQDDSNRLSGSGWPRVSRDYIAWQQVQPSASNQIMHQRLRRQAQGVGQAVAATKTAGVASQVASGSVPSSGLPSGGGLPTGSGLQSVGLPAGSGLPTGGAGSPSAGVPNAGLSKGLASVPSQNSLGKDIPKTPTDQNGLLGQKAPGTNGLSDLTGQGSPNGLSNGQPPGQTGSSPDQAALATNPNPATCVFPDTNCDLVLPSPRGATPPPPLLPKLLLPRHKAILDQNPAALQSLTQH